mgnify:CR=1 FL=1
MATKAETKYQAGLVRRLSARFPGCFIIENNPLEVQGIPDLILLWGKHWAMLEVKISATADVQPNQAYYVTLFDEMSFGAFVYPENEQDVLNALSEAFGA